MLRVYKIVDAAAWSRACACGVFHGAEIDLKDGYVHFSTESQVEATARLHFADQTGLLLVAFSADDLGDELKWEASRGGDLFPHLYGTLDPALALWAKPLPWNSKHHDFPQGWKA